MERERQDAADPRERVETGSIEAVMILDETESVDGKAYWDIINPEGTDWAHLVAFAQAILAADAAWKNKAPCGCDSRELTYKTCAYFVSGTRAQCITCGHNKACHDAREANR